MSRHLGQVVDEIDEIRSISESFIFENSKQKQQKKMKGRGKVESKKIQICDVS